MQILNDEGLFLGLFLVIFITGWNEWTAKEPVNPEMPPGTKFIHTKKSQEESIFEALAYIFE